MSVAHQYLAREGQNEPRVLLTSIEVSGSTGIIRQIAAG